MMTSERRHIPVGKQHIGVGNVCIWCDQPMPCREILLDEHQRLLQRSRDEDTARIRLNHARIEAEAEVARLQALLAERDAAVARAERAESERDVYRDALTLISRGVWTARNSVESIVWGAREALKKGAALAAASEGEG